MLARLLCKGLSMIGIYGIRNIIDGKLYVGQSSQVEARWVHHKRDLNNNKHHNKHLQSAWNKYGADSFIFYIIEECSQEELDGYEAYWIDYYHSYECGYNLDCGGGGIRGYKHTEEELVKMRQIQKPKRVAQFDLNMNYLRSWESASTAGKELGHQSASGIKRCCEHDKYKKAYGYRWAYEEDYLTGTLDYDYYLSPNKNQKYRISKYDQHMNLVGYYQDCADAAADLGVSPATICEYCNPKRHGKICGYILRKTDYYSHEEYLADVEWDYSKFHSKKVFPVELYDLDWNYVATYPSIREALDANGIRSNNVHACLREPHRQCGGFHWKKAIA